MAKYDITHNCGHIQTHQIFGTNSNGERDRKEAWLMTTDCTDCWREKKDKAIADERAAAKALADSIEQLYGLAALSGSDKQIAWARAIRAEYIGKLSQDRITVLLSMHTTRPILLTAKWWIEQRQCLSATLDAMLGAGQIEKNYTLCTKQNI